VLAVMCERYHCVVHSFCLMSNHFHLMLETVEPNLGRAMRHLNGEYTQYFNRRHRSVGHLFQGRYKAILVQKESYLLELSRYIVLNPVRAKMVDLVEDWPWSSHRYYLGDAPAPDWLERDWLLAQFGQCRTQAVAAYRTFVAAGIDSASPLAETRHQILLGDDDFVAEHHHLQQSEELVDTLRVERAAVALSLAEYRSRFPDRTEAMARAYLSTAFTMPMIGHAFGVSAKTVGRAVAAWEAAARAAGKGLAESHGSVGDNRSRHGGVEHG
jgi:putative transposase